MNDIGPFGHPWPKKIWGTSRMMRKHSEKPVRDPRKANHPTCKAWLNLLYRWHSLLPVVQQALNLKHNKFELPVLG